MSKVLVYTSPARGHLYPITPTLDELHRRGHAIALRTLTSQVATMRARGFDAAPITPKIEAMPLDDYQARTPQTAMKRAVAAFASRAEHEVADLQAAITHERPDGLLIDGQTWGALAVAEAWGGPWASWLPYPMPLPSPQVPPFGPGLAPAHGALGRIRDSALRILLVRSVERTMLPPLNGVRAGLKLDPLAGAGELFTRPPALLYLTAEPFEYPRTDWPANIHMIGPGTWDPPADPPPWLAQIERPIVLVTTSSEFQNDDRLVTTALQALADEPVHVVATLPSGDPGAFAARPNAHVLPFTPHGPLLQRAACAITHGGMSATQKALAAGVPVCAVPFGRDQLEVARRVTVAGGGHPPERRTPTPRPPPRPGTSSDGHERGRSTHRRRLQGGRRGQRRRKRTRAPTGSSQVRSPRFWWASVAMLLIVAAAVVFAGARCWRVFSIADGLGGPGDRASGRSVSGCASFARRPTPREHRWKQSSGCCRAARAGCCTCIARQALVHFGVVAHERLVAEAVVG